MAEYMGGPLRPRNKAQEQSTANRSLCSERQGGTPWPTTARRSAPGRTSEPINETIAGTGPGIPDDALAPGEELPEPPSDEEVEAVAEELGAPSGRTRHASARR